MQRSILTAVTVGAVLALAACSGGDATSTAPATTGSTSASPTDEATPELGGTLTVWVDETRINDFKALATEYQAKTGVTVKLVQKASGDIRTDFVKQVPTGAGPDVIIGAHDWTGEFVANGVVQPIQLGDKASEFNPVSISAFTDGGQVYGLPYATENIALVRNNKLVDSTPDTFDGLVDQGKSLKTKYPLLLQVTTDGDAYHMYPIQTSFGAPIFTQNSDGSYTQTLGLGGDSGHKFAEYIQKLGKEGVLNTAIGGDQAKEAFSKGQSAYIITGPWYTSDFVKAGMDISVLPVPSAGGSPSLPFVGVQGAFISAKTQNAIVANDFVVNYLGSADVQTAIYKSGGRMPALTAAADQVDDAVLKGFADASGTAPMPGFSFMGDLWAQWGGTQAQIIGGQAKDADKAWDKMVDNLQSVIDKATK